MKPDFKPGELYLCYEYDDSCYNEYIINYKELLLVISTKEALFIYSSLNKDIIGKKINIKWLPNIRKKYEKLN